MADPLDILTLAEARTAMHSGSVAVDGLEQMVTAVSRIIDDSCGPVVVRTITDEEHQGHRSSIRLNRWPVTSFTSVEESDRGSVSTLSAVTFGSTSDGYRAPRFTRDPTLYSGVLRRRRYGCAHLWADEVQVTYDAGRYATTETVDERFKAGCAAVLRRLWKRESASWSQAPAFLESSDSQPSSGFYRAVKPIVEELLFDEVQTHLVGFA